MDGASSSSNASQPMSEARKIEYPCGTDSECLRIKSSATLWLMGAGRHSDPLVGVIRQGEDFSFRTILQTQSPILVTFCMVGDLQWPLTRDTPVLRVGKRSFAFAMPGLLYGLQFSCCCCEEVLENVERIFMRFGHYENHSGGKDTDGTQFSVLPEDDPGFWAAAQLKIQKMVEPFLARLGATDKSPTTTNDTNGRVLRALRMSAVTKMIAKGVLVGGIDPNEHIELFGPSSSSDEDEDDGIVQSPRASATIFVFSDIVEAMEAYSVIVSGRYQSMPPYEPKWTPLPDITFWNISKLGLIRLLQVMVASSAMNMEMIGNSILRMAGGIDKVAEPMDEDLNIMVETKESANANEFMEDMANNNDEAIAPIREIRFSIIDEVGNMNADEKNHHQVGKLREACSSMEVA